MELDLEKLQLKEVIRKKNDKRERKMIKLVLLSITFIYLFSSALENNKTTYPKVNTSLDGNGVDTNTTCEIYFCNYFDDSVQVFVDDSLISEEYLLTDDDLALANGFDYKLKKDQKEFVIKLKFIGFKDSVCMRINTSYKYHLIHQMKPKKEFNVNGTNVPVYFE